MAGNTSCAKRSLSNITSVPAVGLIIISICLLFGLYITRPKQTDDESVIDFNTKRGRKKALKLKEKLNVNTNAPQLSSNQSNGSNVSTPPPPDDFEKLDSP